MKHVKIILALTVALLMFSGFFGLGEEDLSVKEQRQALLTENTKILNLLYKRFPNAKTKLNRAYGYATFSNIGLNLFIVSTERGSGLAHNNKTGKNTYMNMFSAGGGLGMGVKDFVVVFTFDNKKVFDDFQNSGWEANAQADAAAKSADKGDDVSAAVTVAPGVKLYKMTKAGVALQATVQGTKYWIDEELN